MLKPLCAAGLTLVAALSVPRSPPTTTVASSSEVFSWLADRGGLLRVAVGADPNGVRGLVATEAAAVGAVLLQVPLNATLTDHDDDDGASLPGEPPAWCASLPWNVQLAVCVLQQRADADSPWGPFLRSWPCEPPPLPKNLDSTQLAEAQDELFEAEADSDYFWAEEQYLKLLEAAEAAGQPPPCSAAELRVALEQVWSRCLRLTAGPHGVRRLLVPVLDLANHEAQPSALFTYSAVGGGSIRLHATRPLLEGDAVTITYGEHSAEHFCRYYGFVPSDDPHAAWRLRTATLLSALPAVPAALEAAAISPPEAGWAGVLAALNLPAEIEIGALLPLAAPLAAVQAALRLVPGADASERGAAAALDAALGELGGCRRTTLAEDEALLPTIADDEATRPLVQMRIARKRLLALLQARLRAQPCAVEPPPLPSMYPALDALPTEELLAWGERPW